jgi:hypothetical protein
MNPTHAQWIHADIIKILDLGQFSNHNPLYDQICTLACIVNLNRPTHRSWSMHTLGHARIMQTARFEPPDSMESPGWTIYKSSHITNRVCIGRSDAHLQLNSTCGSSLKHAPLLHHWQNQPCQVVRCLRVGEQLGDLLILDIEKAWREPGSGVKPGTESRSCLSVDRWIYV